MKEGARVHHSYGFYPPSPYGSQEPRRANPSTANLLGTIAGVVRVLLVTAPPAAQLLVVYSLPV
jgi:hypothetical protein